jgi:hypothetical protein
MPGGEYDPQRHRIDYIIWPDASLVLLASLGYLRETIEEHRRTENSLSDPKWS